MTINYWTNYSKKKNSTKQPTSGTSLTVTLKDDCSIINPIIRSASLPVNANYIYISDFGRYYFVTNVVYITKDLKEFSLEVDVLASYKTSIGSTVARIAFAATGWNKEIADARMGVEGGLLTYRQPESIGLSKTGCYVLGTITDQHDGKVGAVNYYILQPSAMENLMDMINDTNFLSDIEQYFNGSWLDLIVMCTWIPVDYVTAGTLFGDGFGLTSVYMGKKDTGLVGYDVVNPIAEVSNVSLAIPYKWQDFRDCQPYTSASLYLPGIGLTDLNINDFYASTNVSIITRIDVTTGDVTYKIFNDAGTELKTVIFNGCAQVALARETSNVGGVLGGVGGTIGGAVGVGISVATGNVLGVLGSGAALIGAASSTMLAFNQRSTSVKGSNTGRSGYEDISAVLILVCKRTEDIDNASYIAKNGRPVCVTHAISSHSGYVQCDNASVDMVGTSLEKERVNQYLNSGFYYE